MRLLALDTATEACSVALWLDGEIVERFEVAGRDHSLRLPRMLDALLAETGVSLRQLDGLVCGVGPGSFAGVRIGVGYMKGLALGLELGIAPVSSLAMLAEAALRVAPDATVLAAIDARMDEVYYGCYRGIAGGAQLIGTEGVAPPGTIAIAMPPTRGVGSGWGAYPGPLAAATGIPAGAMDPGALPHAAEALRRVAGNFVARAVDAADLVPAYLRNRVALTRSEQQAARDATRS